MTDIDEENFDKSLPVLLCKINVVACNQSPSFSLEFSSTHQYLIVHVISYAIEAHNIM